MPIAAIFAEEAAAALAAELAPYAAGEAALAAGTVLGAEALMGLGTEALGTSAIGGAEAALTADAMAANAAAGGAGAGGAGINAAQVAAQQNAAMQAANAANAGITGIPQVQTFPVEGFQPDQLSRSLVSPPMAAQPPMGLEGQFAANQFIEPGSAGIPSMENTIAQANIPVTPPSPLEVGMDKAIKFAEKNPFTAMTAAYMGANALGLLNPSGATFNNAPYSGPLSKYFLSPNFQGRTANPADFQYRPRYAAGGGIMSADPYSIPVGYDDGGDVPEYAAGGSLSDSIASYQRMLSGNTPAAPAASHDVGIYYDLDPDTRYQDALTAAQIRQAKVNQRAYVSPPAAKRPTPMGKLNLPTSAKSKSDVEAASGGIMRSYAGGGITGEGNLDLHIPLNLGGGGGGGYTPVGGGFSSGGGGSGNTSVFNGQNNTVGGNFGGMGSLMPSQGLGSAPQQSGYGGIPPAFMSTNKGSSYNTTTTSDIMGRNMNIPAGLDDTMTPGMMAENVANQQKNAASRANTAANPASMSDLARRLGIGMANGGMTGYAMGGGIMQSSLGGYAAGGNPRLLKGPGDGMSDNIPATINGRQPARLADGEFVIPADVVSHLGNGSTDAGAKQLHAMMDKVRKARTGNPKQGKEINPKKYMPK